MGCVCDMQPARGGAFLIHTWPVALNSLLFMHLRLLSGGVGRACFLCSLRFSIQFLKVELHLQLLQKYWPYPLYYTTHPSEPFLNLQFSGIEHIGLFLRLK